MPIQFVSENGVLKIPGAYPKINVQNQPSSLSTTGVLVLMGESNQGPDFSEEESLNDNTFGPDETGAIVSKYDSGSIVDAFRGAVSAANDPNIVGSFSRAMIVKTNAGVKAAGTLPAIGGGDWSNILAKSAGKNGNLISRTLTQKTAEVVPTTGSLLLAPPQVNTDVAFRVNGGAEVSDTINAADTPDVMVVALDALTGVSATGGTDRNVITAAAGNLTLTQDSGFQCHVIIDTAWANNPSVGDIIYIPVGSPFAPANEGTYVCTAVTTTRIDMYKVLDAAGAGADLTAPSTEGPVAVAAITDVQGFAPVVLTNTASAVVPGLGKSLEVANSGVNDFSDMAFVFVGATASPPATAYSNVSSASSPKVIKSSAEYRVSLNISRQSDSVNETVDSFGDVILTLGYEGTTATAVIDAGVMTITVTGGAGTSLGAITLSDYTTINDLASFISSFTGYSASASIASLGQNPPSDLDPGTYTFGSTHGANTGRIKSNGARFLERVNADSTLINLEAISPATSLIGLPDVSSLTFLTGGSKGGTLSSDITAAFTALESTRCNFVVPLFSRDATVDIANNQTEATSTYTISGIHALLNSHVLLMSQFKQRRPRQGVASIKDTFDNAKQAAGSVASSRVNMLFQDVKDVNSQGVVVQFQPWMAAVKVASMQSAAFNQPIFNKFMNISGVVASGFNDQSISQMEDALDSGLMPLIKDPAGGFRVVSDQTTYTADSNFVFNSLQAVYDADVVAQTVAQRMERAFVGKTPAQVPASLALTVLEAILGDMRRLKLISPSDDAPRGFKNAVIKIEGPVMIVSVEIKLSTGIYFIPITFAVSQVEQTATG